MVSNEISEHNELEYVFLQYRYMIFLLCYEFLTFKSL